MVVVNWLDLPDHILLVIAEKLFIDIKDFIRFGAVCQSWRSLYILNHRYACMNLPHQLPMLMLPPSEVSITDNQTCCFYGLIEKKVYNFRLPVPHDRYYRGFSQGWLITVSVKSPAVVHLLNPFNNNQIELPPLSTFGPLDDLGCTNNTFLLKVVLSANPTLNPKNYVVIAIFGQYDRMAFYKPGDNAWTSLDVEPGSKNQAWQQARKLSAKPASLQRDVIYYKNKFYAVDYCGALWVYDLSVPHTRLHNLVPPLNDQFYDLKYIVQSCGHLLLVGRSCPWWDDDYYFTIKFQVFKLDWFDLKWTETKDLCGQMLFLGDNESLSLLASDYPGCKQNHIYFTDNYIERYYFGDECRGPPDMGVYNLEDDTVEPHYQVRQSNRFHPAPIWIEPTLGEIPGLLSLDV